MQETLFIGLALLGIGLGTGLAVLGAAFGIARIGSGAVESTARQPEAGGQVFLQMLLSAALIEGFTFFALVQFGGFGKTIISAIEAITKGHGG